jgi:hypothetical protein
MNTQKVVILIGPYGAGKTEIARIFSQKFGWCWHSVDECYFRYLKQFVPDAAEISNQINKLPVGSPERQNYNIYDIEVIARLLDEVLHSRENSVIDFGADHSLYPDKKYLNRAYKTLLPYDVVLLLPSQEMNECCRILLSRIRSHGIKGHDLTDSQIIEWVTRSLQEPSNQLLAKHIIFTENQSPNETFRAICQLLKLPTRE